MSPAVTVLTAAARIALQAATQADFRGLNLLLPRLTQSQSGPEARAWAFVLETVRWSFDLSPGPIPTPDDARQAVREGDAVAADIVSRACPVMERVAFSMFDRPRLSSWIALHSQLVAEAAAGGHGHSGHGEISISAARLWDRLLAGEATGLDSPAKALLEDAARLGVGEAVIEANVIRALAALARGAVDDAVDLGRRAARMAHSEGLSQHEYLANVALARIRRFSGRPHLSLHILAALRRVAPRSWSGWLAWETMLAGGKVASDESGGITAADDPTADAPARVADGVLRALLVAAASGNRGAFDAAAAQLGRTATACPHLGQEVEALIPALDPERASSKAIDGWRRGQVTDVPHGLYGVGVSHDLEPNADSATAYVFSRPGESGRRFLAAGLPLVQGCRLLTRGSAKMGTRTETGLAALALAGEGGITRGAFFRSVYGFPFVPERHRAVLDVLCHRMRHVLGDAGEILRDGGAGASEGADPSLALVLREPVVVPDMRCVLPMANRVLRALATLGTASAGEAADRLRMPLRTVQALLQQLVGDGACVVERDGRRIAYRIEDTTFTGVSSG